MKKVFFLFTLLFLASRIIGNNLVVGTSVKLTEQNVTSDYAYIQFDISWDNSWNVNGTPDNWDAAWVFVKYRLTSTGAWQHVKISVTDADHSVTTNNSITPIIKAGKNDLGGGLYEGVGVFMYRATFGTGSINWDGVKLKWNYGDAGITDQEAAGADFKVFGIEMVYVKQGSFYVGDGSTTNVRGHFTADNTSNYFWITSENPLTLGGTATGNLGNSNTTGMQTVDDFNDASSKTLPVDYPKGFAAFYIMKYEITQEQYVDFLNCLNYYQQAGRTEVTPNSVAGTRVMYTGTGYRNSIEIQTSGASPGTPAVYGVDYNNDGTYNQDNDGQNIACNFLSWMDGCAYTDWAGLRPMTELEYEKACRGGYTPSTGEYAWGSTYIIAPSVQNNQGGYNEAPSNSANCMFNNGTPSGPVRVGCFADASSSRVNAGAGFYGAMELSGNVWERAVGVGSTRGRGFTGSHGNGDLTNVAGYYGNATNNDWPGISATISYGVTAALGGGFRGGTWYHSSGYTRVSDRYYANANDASRYQYFGFRSVRTAP